MLSFRQKSDIALSIANVIINEKLVPETQIDEFINKFPSGKVEFGYSPEDVEKRTGVSKDKIIEIAHKISKGKSIVLAGGSTSAYTNGKFNTYVVFALNILLGSVGKTGGVILNPEVEKDLMTVQCLKQLVLPEDIARIALFLSSDDSKFMTAQVYKGDAGLV
mgnify:CR=1 FL=1